ncbi:hypothetical protein N7532_001408 [Penicillium argentinense]|uniref:Uncharacterized protein n=1 Tax=Penicillium argentinense TaxID=1131581 RepID=A0A9W9G2I9_9EURO|nr:uncharacterized protein N7532_001408 [Penicillium argentinense]KAJ5110873.1 hypothetical protein N7532_001408 [Penicillium argentinense]
MSRGTVCCATSQVLILLLFIKLKAIWVIKRLLQEHVPGLDPDIWAIAQYFERSNEFIYLLVREQRESDLDLMFFTMLVGLIADDILPPAAVQRPILGLLLSDQEAESRNRQKNLDQIKKRIVSTIVDLMRSRPLSVFLSIITELNVNEKLHKVLSTRSAEASYENGCLDETNFDDERYGMNYEGRF